MGRAGARGLGRAMHCKKRLEKCLCNLAQSLSGGVLEITIYAEHVDPILNSANKVQWILVRRVC